MSVFDSYRINERARVARGIVTCAFAVLLGAFFRTQIIVRSRSPLLAGRSTITWDG